MNQKTVMKLGEFFRTARERSNLSQNELSNLSDVSRRAIQRLENNESVPTVETASKILMALSTNS